MDYANLQRIIAETDAAYQQGQFEINRGNVARGTQIMQAAVSNRDAAIRSYQAYLASLTPSSSSSTQPSSASTPPPPPPVPKLPTFIKFTDNRYDIKVAPRDTVIFDQDQESVQLMQELLYEELGGVELANMSRSDLIDGQQVSYTAIANLLQINRMYNPNNIVSSGNSDQGNFSIYSIDLLSRGVNIPKFDAEGNIVIVIDEVNSGELIEYQIALNGTIDRVDSI